VHPQGRWFIEDDPATTHFDWCAEGHNRMAMKMATPARRLPADQVRIDEQLAAMIQPWGLDPDDFRGREFDVRPALQRVKRELAPGRGFRIDGLTDDQLTDAYHYNVFPNTTVTFAGCEYVGVQRMRPHATDPQRHHYDNFTYAAVGSETDADLEGLGGKEWLTEGAERQSFDYGERLMNRRVADQDLGIAAGQQLGLASRAYSGAHLPTQEDRIQYFHDVLMGHLEGRR
jgi:phenylpropionate dioxygenase-like ring-hydroxylating dioxygenase large terminal subunit